MRLIPGSRQLQRKALREGDPGITSDQVWQGWLLASAGPGTPPHSPDEQAQRMSTGSARG